jgi:DNA-binding IclR family transcriptional regulator
MSNTSTIDQAGVPADARRGIQSLEIGLAILHVLARMPGPATLKEIAGAADIPSSNCHRYLVSFTRQGFVVQDSRNGRYDLGPAVLNLGLAAMGRLDEIGIATDALESLVEETGNTGMVVIWANAGPTIVRWMQGREPVRTTLSAGSVLPVSRTASGRMFLAFLPRRQTAELTRGSDEQELEALIRRDRSAGWAQVSGDHIPGLNAAAAPVLGPTGEAAAVLTLVRAGEPLSLDALMALRHHAGRASQRLGAAAN